MPRFSVVIPTYNRAALIGATLESVLLQEHPVSDFEVIVVDDGSTDDTADVLARYADRVRVFRQENSGTGAARALGAANARGHYICCLDSDDLWFPWTLRTLADAIERHGSPSLLMGAATFFGDPVEVRGMKAGQTDVVEYPDLLAAGENPFWFSASSITVRRDALDAGGGPTRLRCIMDDLDLLLRLGTAQRLVYIRSPVTVAYRSHGVSAMGNIEWCAGAISSVLREETAGRYPGGAARERDRARLIAFHHRAMSVRCIERGRPELGWRLYGEGLTLQARLGRVRYLLGFPLLAARQRLSRPKGPTPAPSHPAAGGQF